MNDEQTKKNVDDTCNESKEDSLWSMVGDFYSKKMRSAAILVWVWGIIFFVPAVYSAIKFFKTDRTKDLILYAAIFICCFNGICLMKVFAWLMINRHDIKREIKKLKR
jgi:hypothetical protein